MDENSGNLVVWTFAKSALLWVIWLERNARVFEDKSAKIESLWNRIWHFSSFLDLISPPFILQLELISDF